MRLEIQLATLHQANASEALIVRVSIGTRLSSSLASHPRLSRRLVAAIRRVGDVSVSPSVHVAPSDRSMRDGMIVFPLRSAGASPR